MRSIIRIIHSSSERTVTVAASDTKWTFSLSGNFLSDFSVTVSLRNSLICTAAGREFELANKAVQQTGEQIFISKFVLKNSPLHIISKTSGSFFPPQFCILQHLFLMLMKTVKITLIMSSLRWSSAACALHGNVRVKKLKWRQTPGRGKETPKPEQHEGMLGTNHHKNRQPISSLRQPDRWTSAMAAHVMLLFLLFCKGERRGVSEAVGLSEEDPDSPVISDEKQQVLHHPESPDKFFIGIKELESHVQDSESDVRTLPNVAFQLSDGKANDSDFKSNAPEQIDTRLKPPDSSAKPLMPKHSSELTVNREKRNNLTNGEVEGVINDHSLVPSSEEEYALQPRLYLEAGVSDVGPERPRGLPNWVTESERGRSEPYLLPHARRRRSWLWNQFFVIEEYRGPEPVLIGRVSHRRSQSARTCESPESHCIIAA